MGAKKDQNTYLEEKMKGFKGRVRFHDLKATFSVKFNDEDSSISRFKARLYYAGPTSPATLAVAAVVACTMVAILGIP